MVLLSKRDKLQNDLMIEQDKIKQNKYVTHSFNYVVFRSDLNDLY